MSVVLGNFMRPCGTEPGKCEFSRRLLHASSVGTKLSTMCPVRTVWRAALRALTRLQLNRYRTGLCRAKRSPGDSKGSTGTFGRHPGSRSRNARALLTLPETCNRGLRDDKRASCLGETHAASGRARGSVFCARGE